MSVCSWSKWCIGTLLVIAAHGGGATSSIAVDSSATDRRTLEERAVREVKIRQLLEESERDLPGGETLEWRRVMAAELRDVPSRMPDGQSLLVMGVTALDMTVFVVVWSVPDKPRIELLAFWPKWYRDDVDFQANQEGGRVLELVDGEVILEKELPLSAASTRLLSEVALNVIPRAPESPCCQRLIHNALGVTMIRIDSTGALAEVCLSRWTERAFGGLEDILLGLVGMSVAQVRVLESGRQ